MLVEFKYKDGRGSMTLDIDGVIGQAVSKQKKILKLIRENCESKIDEIKGYCRENIATHQNLLDVYKKDEQLLSSELNATDDKKKSQELRRKISYRQHMIKSNEQGIKRYLKFIELLEG